MLKQTTILFVTVILTYSCAPTQVLVIPEPFQVTKELWVKCWESCGRGDKLASVDPAYCNCTSEIRFQHGADPIEIKLEDLEAEE